jgi:hypothetical protein
VVPREVLESIRRNKVCLKGTLFTQLDKQNTNTQSLNVQVSAGRGARGSRGGAAPGRAEPELGCWPLAAESAAAAPLPPCIPPQQRPQPPGGACSRALQAALS